MTRNDEYTCFAPFEADADIAGPGREKKRVFYTYVLTSKGHDQFLIDGLDNVFRRMCPALLCYLHAVQISPTKLGIHSRDHFIFIANLSRDEVSRVSKFIRMLIYGFRCTLAMVLSLFSDDRPQLQLFSQMALDRLCDLQLITGTAILIAGIAELHTMSFYHQSLVLSYWLLTLNAFWAARAGYLSSDHYGNDRSFYFWTRWVAILISDILSIYYQIETTLEAANHWDSSESGHCYLSHEPSSTNSQYFWIVGITFEVLYMILYSIHRIVQCLPSRFQLLKNLSNSIAHTSKELTEESRHGAANLRKKVRLSTQTLWTPLKTVVICLELILVGVWWFIWHVLALWAWGDSTSVTLVLGYIALAAWNTFDVLDTKLSNRHLVIGDESDWGFGQILPLGLLALICLDLLDIVNSKFLNESSYLLTSSIEAKYT
ncbi:hypothetical protein CJF31_00010425 [Rutstroemia sp. NJR-2017a BVV2]|nr:hypothetical protein CJF31_00010425 [Rutstroemia sp. NJR-2017a BVV2]